MKNIAEMLSKKKGWDKSRGQFQICISVRGECDVGVLFGAIQISEYEEKLKKRHAIVGIITAIYSGEIFIES